MDTLKDKRLMIITNSYPNEDNSYYGGIFVKEQVKYLSKYFNEVYVISPQPWGVNGNLRDYIDDNVRVFFPRFFHLPIELYRKRLGDNFFKAALKVITAEKLEFDLIHAHFTWPSGYAGVKLAKEFGVPSVVTAHGDDVRIPLTGYLKSFDNIFLKRILDKVVEKSGVIITHHEELYDLLIKEYVMYIGKIKFIYKGIDLSRFDPTNENLLKKAEILKKDLGISGRFVVLFLARVDWDKDPLTFVKASKLLKRYNDINFIMVGEGKLRGSCISLKNKYGLSNLLIVGPQRNTELWYSIADVFTALSPVENIWSTTLQEAFCMGLPVIATNVGYTPKILKNKKDAILIPPKNPEALAHAILDMKNDEKLRDILSKNALKWRAKFDIKSTTSKILSIYKELVNT